MKLAVSSLEAGAGPDEPRLARAAEPGAAAQLRRLLGLRGEASALRPQRRAGRLLLLRRHLVAGHVLREGRCTTTYVQ